MDLLHNAAKTRYMLQQFSSVALVYYFKSFIRFEMMAIYQPISCQRVELPFQFYSKYCREISM